MTRFVRWRFSVLSIILAAHAAMVVLSLASFQCSEFGNCAIYRLVFLAYGVACPAVVR